MFTPRRAMMVLALLLLVSSLLPARLSRSVTAVPRAAFAVTVEPLAGWLYRLSLGVRSEPGSANIDQHQDLTRDQLEQDYARALQIISALSQANDDLQQQLAQFVQIQQHRAADGAPGQVGLISARVTTARRGARTAMLSIDAGSRQGVGPGMAVTAGSSLVGRVEQVTPLSADVKLIATADTDLQVRIRPPRAALDPRDYPARMHVHDSGRAFVIRQVDRREPLHVGDLVHLADPRWPEEAQGFLLGQVARIAEDPDDPYNFKSVIVHPIAPLHALARVTVLIPTD